MKQRKLSGDRSAVGWPAGAERLPLLTSKLYHPPVTIQQEQPQEAIGKANWLPAPKEGFRFTARFYGPYTPLFDGSYNMPGVVCVN